MITQGELNEWLSHPITQEFRSIVRAQRDSTLMSIPGANDWDDFNRKSGAYIIWSSLADHMHEMFEIK